MARILIAVAFIGVAAGQSGTIYVPQYGHGVDAFGNSFSTTISFINLDNTTNRVDVRVFDQSGEPVELLRRPGSVFEAEAPSAQVGVEIAPLGYETAASLSADPAAGVRVGWVEIEGEAAVDVEVLFSIRDAVSGTLTTSTSIIPGPAVTEASFIAFAAAGSNTGVALLNPPANAAEAVVDLMVFDRFGRPVGQTEVRLAPGAQTARFLTEFVSGLVDFAGTFELRANLPVSVLPLRQDGVELTTQVVHPGRVIQ